MKKFAKVMAVALVCLLAVAALVACGPASNPDKAKAKLEKKGYTVVLDKNNKADEDGVVAELMASTKDGKNMISITYYESSKAAKKAYDEGKDEMAEIKKYYAEMLGVKESDIVIKQSGKMVYMGTKAAVKAAG